MGRRWKYFSYDGDPKIKGVKPWFIEIADHVRHLAGLPMIVTSGFRRTKTGSSHEKGLAMDIRSKSWRHHFKFVVSSWHNGIRRMGVYVQPFKCPHCKKIVEGVKLKPSHFHMDKDEEKDQDVLWIGISK
jgi:hypothetical protein